MGSALIRGLISSGFANPEDICLYDLAADAVAALLRETRVASKTSISEVIKASDIVVLAIKPQVIEDVLAEAAKASPEGRLFVSIAAGIPTKRIENLLPGNIRVIRVMPNAAAMVGESIASISAGTFASAEDVALAAAMFRAVGESLIVPEGLVDRVTAISGSGPAYFFLLAESLIAAAMKIGFSKEQSDVLVRQTFIGSAKMLAKTGERPEDLRAMITSPNGTTEAAVNIFEKEGFSMTVSNAVQAALDRAAELGR